eukprot:gene9701-biopygen7677
MYRCRRSIVRMLSAPHPVACWATRQPATHLALAKRAARRVVEGGGIVSAHTQSQAGHQMRRAAQTTAETARDSNVTGGAADRTRAATSALRGRRRMPGGGRTAVRPAGSHPHPPAVAINIYY